MCLILINMQIARARSLLKVRKEELGEAAALNRDNKSCKVVIYIPMLSRDSSIHHTDLTLIIYEHSMDVARHDPTAIAVHMTNTTTKKSRS